MIGIIGAMEEEVAGLKEEMLIEETVEQAGMTFYQGQIVGKEVVVVMSGIGKVNAAICVQILVDLFHVSAIINTGVAGSLNAKLDIGDMVISSDAVQHDMDTTAAGDPAGQVPRMDTWAFPADGNLVHLAKEVNEDVNPDIRTMVGRVLSGDQFISSADVKNRLIDQFGGYCAEMEGAAIAHAAYLNKVPCVIIRAISDKADNSAQMDYPVFARKAIEHSVRLIMGMMPRL